jgi:putative membrane protein
MAADQEQVGPPPGAEPRPLATATRLHDRRAREHLANERTLLAWVRTSLGLIALGFVVARFALLFRQANVADNGRGATSTVFGIILVAGGFVAAVVGLVRYLRVRRQIDEDDFKPDAGTLVLLVGIALAMALALGIYLVVTG